jgi:hypothetical protein
LAFRVGDDCAGLPARDPRSDVLWLSLAIDTGRLFTRSGDSGNSGDARLGGNSNALGGSMDGDSMYATEVFVVVLFRGQLHDLVCVRVCCV